AWRRWSRCSSRTWPPRDSCSSARCRWPASRAGPAARAPWPAPSSRARRRSRRGRASAWASCSTGTSRRARGAPLVADLVVVGSVALDSVKTPFGEVREALGGSATYFAYAASFFAPVRVVAAVGEDFPKPHLTLLSDRGVDIEALEVLPGKPTFRWAGGDGFDLNDAKTLDTQLNVFAEFRPSLPAAHRAAPFLFLANIDPDLQWDVRQQMKAPLLTALDTMNFWIEGKRDSLLRILREVDVL